MNERPRDRLGRPLPWGSAGYPGVEQRTRITAAEATAEAHAYLADGLPFHAHEVLEIRWRCCPSGERDLWQGLAQLAAGATHAARGNSLGSKRLLERGRSMIEGYPDQVDDATRALIDALTGADPDADDDPRSGSA